LVDGTADANTVRAAIEFAMTGCWNAPE